MMNLPLFKFRIKKFAAGTSRVSKFMRFFCWQSEPVRVIRVGQVWVQWGETKKAPRKPA